MKRNALLLGSALVVSLLLIEVGLRIFGITYPVFDVYDHDRAVALKPGKQGWYHGEGGAYLKINSLGYRDVEHTKDKPAGVVRIAVLGDSFTEARQVDISETFWKRLQTRLPDRPGFGARSIEVLNFGIGGYGTAQALLTLRLHVRQFSPDVVVLAFCPGNDLADNSKPLISQVGRAFRPFYVLHDDQLALDNSFREFSLDYLRRWFLLTSVHYSRIMELVNQARRVAFLRAMQQAPRTSHEIGLFDEEFLEPTSEVWKEAWRVTAALIVEMNKEVVKTGARFVLLTLTTPIQVDPDVQKREAFQRKLGVTDLFYTERRLRELGQTFGFPVITLGEPFQKAATQRGVYFHGFQNTGFGMGHWNTHGHALAADILTEQLPRALEATPKPGSFAESR